jgi:Fe-S cluster assembly iron-binding protein IscA
MATLNSTTIATIAAIIDSKALMALVGTEMDYVENELGSEFVFNNPN